MRGKNEKKERREEEEKRKRGSLIKGEHIKNRENVEKIDSPVLLSTLSLKLRSKKLL